MAGLVIRDGQFLLFVMARLDIRHGQLVYRHGQLVIRHGPACPGHLNQHRAATSRAVTVRERRHDPRPALLAPMGIDLTSNRGTVLDEMTHS
jgi:hypothetical protein